MAITFQSSGLNPSIIKGIERKGYDVPTPVQRKTIPLINSGSDVLAVASNGSGKTAAFLLPMFEMLRNHSHQAAGPRALILSPTRVSALHTFKSAQDFGLFTDLQISLLTQGDSLESQFIKELALNPDIIIATPDRLLHHLSEVEHVSLRSVDATLPSALVEFAKASLRDPHLVLLDLETKISPNLKLFFFTLRQEEKHAALLYLIEEMISSGEHTLIFVSTKYHVEFLNVLFEERGIQPSVCYGDMDQDARKMHVSKFRARKNMLLIVTDVAARGIDIPLLDNVINWDFPSRPKLFVHRVGRAARAGRTGTVFSFVTSDDMPHILDLHLFLSKPIRAAPTEEEVSHDVNNLMSKIDQAIASGETVYGRFPQTILDHYSDVVRVLLDSFTEIDALERPCAKAFCLYYKRKEKPSEESVKREKKFPRDGLHPIFKSFLGSRRPPGSWGGRPGAEAPARRAETAARGAAGRRFR
ncbi:hypothetical protein AgCh_009400 [Apium graveolens]